MSASTDPRLDHTVGSEDALREIIPAPSGFVLEKELDHLDRFAQAFIALSPMVILATSGADGRADSTPRGDPPGFVQVLDEKHLVIPDRPGNKRLDSMRNILSNPHVGSLFLIPGRGDTLRVNGKASITSDEELLRDFAIRGKVPKVGLLVEVEEVFFHCAAAFKRSQLWNVEHWPDTSALASLGTALVEQTSELRAEGVTGAQLDEDLKDWGDYTASEDAAD